MKKLVIIFLVIFSAIISAQGKFGSIKIGIFSPVATNTGFILGYEGGKNIDEVLSIGFSADWFNKNYIDQHLVKEFNDFYGPNSSLNELRAKTNLHAIPLMATIAASWPVADRMRVFATGGLGLEALLIWYRNYDNPDNNEFKAAFDFAWRLGSGINYELGSRSDGFVELAYNYSQPSWQYEVKDSGTGRTKVFERKFDMSGLMMRVGFRFFF
jgi:opacity protein-like surface antigen